MKYYLIILFIIFCLGSSFGQDNMSISIDSNLCLHGKVFKYFSNGKPKSFKTYDHGFLYGPYEKYYRNGVIKEKGFLDDVNEWTFLFQPSKIVKEKYDKNGHFRKGLTGEIYPIAAVPYGKCQCVDGNINRIKSLLVGTWVKEEMIPFDKHDKITDSVYNSYSTEITFFENDSLSISLYGIQHVGRYFLTSNKLKLEMKNSQSEWESLISLRWPVKTLYPNSNNEHFNLQLIEILNVSDDTGKVKLSNVIVSFRRE